MAVMSRANVRYERLVSPKQISRLWPFSATL